MHPGAGVYHVLHGDCSAHILRCNGRLDVAEVLVCEQSDVEHALATVFTTPMHSGSTSISARKSSLLLSEV